MMTYAAAPIQCLTCQSYRIASGEYVGLDGWLSKAVKKIQHVVQQTLPKPLRAIVQKVDNVANARASNLGRWAGEHKKQIAVAAAIATAAFGGYALYSAYAASAAASGAAAAGAVEAGATAAGAAAAGEATTVATTVAATETLAPITVGAVAPVASLVPAEVGAVTATAVPALTATAATTGGSSLIGTIGSGLMTAGKLAVAAYTLQAAKAKAETAQTQDAMATYQYQQATQPTSAGYAPSYGAGYGSGGGGGAYSTTTPEDGQTPAGPVASTPGPLPGLILGGIALYLLLS